MTQRQHAVVTGGAFLMAFLIPTSYAAAQTVTVLHSFQVGENGYQPTGKLAMGTDSGGQLVLYGNTYSAPPVVFSLTAPTSPQGSWTYAVLANLEGFPGGLVMDSAGVLYGVVGTSSPNCGSVFSLHPPVSAGGSWTESILYAFPCGAEGEDPVGGVAIGEGGVLYGATAYGGTFNDGVVFSLTPPASPAGPWTETVLHSFGQRGDGSVPQAGVMVGPGGALYGTTYFGGTSSACGAVYMLIPPYAGSGVWTERLLHGFTGGDGCHTFAGVVMGSGGVLYGVTEGAAFSVTPPATSGGPWTEAVLHAFGTGSDGASPYGALAIGHNGVLYGTTFVGGANTDCIFGGCGAIFSLTPPASPGGAWTEKVLHNFSGPPSDGNNPWAGVVFGPQGVIYGTTYWGGSYNFGAVFSLKPQQP